MSYTTALFSLLRGWFYESLDSHRILFCNLTKNTVIAAVYKIAGDLENFLFSGKYQHMWCFGKFRNQTFQHASGAFDKYENLVTYAKPI